MVETIKINLAFIIYKLLLFVVWTKLWFATKLYYELLTIQLLRQRLNVNIRCIYETFFKRTAFVNAKEQSEKIHHLKIACTPNFLQSLKIKPMFTTILKKIKFLKFNKDKCLQCLLFIAAIFKKILIPSVAQLYII